MFAVSTAFVTLNFNAATRALQLYLSWANSIHFIILIPICLRSILILSFHLHIGLPKCLFPVGLPVKILKALHSGYMLCPSQSSRFNHQDYIRWTVQTMKFLIVEPSLLPILIRLGPKYSPGDPVNNNNNNNNIIIIIIIVIIPYVHWSNGRRSSGM